MPAGPYPVTEFFLIPDNVDPLFPIRAIPDGQAGDFDPVWLPDPNYVPGPTLFPERVISGYHAELDECTADDWVLYVLG